MDPFLAQGRLDHPSSSKNKWHNVTQTRPGKAQWILWQKAMRLWSDEHGKLYQSLGKWLIPPSQQRRWWPAYATTNGDVFVRAPGEAVRYTKHRVEAHDIHIGGWYQVNTYVEANVQVPDCASPSPMQQRANGDREIYLGKQLGQQQWSTQ